MSDLPVGHDPDASAATTVEEPPGRRPTRAVPVGAFVAATLVAAALGILAVVALTTGNDAPDARSDDVRVAAGTFAERFLTFRHDELDLWKEGVLDRTTGGFLGEVEEVEEGLRRLIGESELVASTRVTEIFVGDIERGTATVVLIYDRDVTGASGTRSETDRYMQLELNLVDGEWLVDNVIDISTAGGLDSQPPEPAEETSDTSPPDS